MTTLTADQQAIADRVHEDPAWFCANVLGSHLYGKQEDILRACWTEPRVSVVGCNGSGKDHATGRLMLAWLSAFHPAKVVVYGPTHRQVNDIVFNEARSAAKGALYPVGGTILQTARINESEDHFAVGFSSDVSFNLQGYHSPNLLVIVTEAHAVTGGEIDALRRLMPRCIIMTGNPLSTSGVFYDSHHSDRALYRTFALSAFDTPNLADDAPDEGYDIYPGMVSKRDVRDRLEEWGEGSVLYISGVLGEFPENLDDSIVPLGAAMAAVKRESQTVDGDGNPIRVEPILACDVARFGRDKTVVVRRDGDRARVVWKVQGRDTMEVAGWIGAYVEAQYDDPAAVSIEHVVIDDTGVGGGVTDRLNELGLPGCSVTGFNGGEKAEASDKYVNAISEAWYEMRKWFLDGVEESKADIEDDRALVGQLTSRGFTYQSDRRIMIESKTKMEKSPDEADALAMTFAGSVGGLRIRWI